MRMQNDTGFLRPHRWLPENLRPFSHEQRPLLYSAGSSLCSMMPVFQTYLCIGFGWTNWNIKNKTPALTRGSSGTPFQNRSVPQVFSKSIRAFESADGLIPWRWWELHVNAFFLGDAPCLQTSPMYIILCNPHRCDNRIHKHNCRTLHREHGLFAKYQGRFFGSPLSNRFSTTRFTWSAPCQRQNVSMYYHCNIFSDSSKSSKSVSCLERIPSSWVS